MPAKTFTKNDLAVRVERLDGWRPRYRVRLGVIREGEFIPSIPMRLQGQGKVQIERIHEDLASLTVEAQDWVHNEAQHRENQILDEKIERETKQVFHGRTQVRVTGKTQRNKEKRKVGAAT